MKKSFMNNIRNFVDSNVLHRNDKATCEYLDDELNSVERQFEDLRRFLVEAEKRISSLLTQNVPTGIYHNISNLTTQNNVTSNSRTSAINTPHRDLSGSICHPNSNPNEKPSASDINSNQFDDDELRRLKKLPLVGFTKFLDKSKRMLKSGSLLSDTLQQCASLQNQLTNLYLIHEKAIESQCLKPIQMLIETDVPNIIRLKKLFLKTHNDLESLKAKYSCASQKQHHQQQPLTNHFTSASYTINQNNSQQANINKLDQLKKELDDAIIRFEQAKDNYATELCTFICRESEIVNIFLKFYLYQEEYQQRTATAIKQSLPLLNGLIATTPRKVVFGTQLDEHLRCIERPLSPVIEVCIHFLYSFALQEEGLFRVPGSAMKIKRLKYAINAWFVTQAGLNVSENEPSQRVHNNSNHDQSSMLAIYNLFRDIACHGQQTAWLQGLNNQVTSPASLGNACYQAQTIPLASLDGVNNSANVNEPTPAYDVHTIAGLLKLYLRELPEPLFTFSLYHQWIKVAAQILERNKKEEDEELLVALRELVEQLPKTNRDNLGHLIRFLHLLTCHKESNKMTASNLSITMAPSLIWAQQSDDDQESGVEEANDAVSGLARQQQNLTVQMNNLGLSASLNALLIEKLIQHAERLFPKQVDFSIQILEDIQTTMQNTRLADRNIKSISPTGLSTASSSSFSSTSSHLTSTKRWNETQIDDVPKGDETSRKSNKPPPVPPYPSTRISRNASYKPSVQAVLQAQMNARVSQNPSNNDTQQTVNESHSTRPMPGSLRGTGTKPLASSNASINVTRPSVPPPNRPVSMEPEQELRISRERNESKRGNDSPQSSRSTASATKLIADYVEINGSELDDMDLVEYPDISPVISIDTISGEDTSFENDDQSLDQSWAECSVDNDSQNAQKRSSDDLLEPALEIGSTEMLDVHHDTLQGDVQKGITQRSNNSEEVSESGPTKPVQPIRPRRIISPKTTQSTIL